jgi:hypothetical protein
MAQKNGENFTAFQAASVEEALMKIRVLQEACSDPSAHFTCIPMVDALPRLP